MRKLLLLLGAVAVLGLLLASHGRRAAITAAAPTAVTAAAPAAPASLSPPPTPSMALPLSPEDLAFLQALRAKLAPQLRNAHGRIRALEQLLNYLKAHYPADWRERIGAFLALLAPELAAQLQAELDALLRYDDWLLAHRQRLSSLAPAQRRAELWQMRHALFGDSADEIWAAERRGEQVQAALAELDRDDGQALDAKLGRYLSAIEGEYGASASQLVETRRTELLNRFLTLDAVQSQLAALPAAARSATLQDLRARMGMDAAALERWSALDRERDQAWEQGQRYRRERDQVAARYQGAEREQRLRALQDELFGADAEVIRSEEAAGFFRYERSRRYGRE